MNKQEFVSKLRKHLHGEVVTSIVENVPYSIEVSIGEGTIKGTRGSSGNSFKIDINELFDAYINCERPLTTPKLKNFITNRTQSPALAVLMELEDRLKSETI